jgi:tetratricopeptide (TPR) repeat protein
MTAPLHASDLYFNMGNLFAKLKQSPAALAAYQKAVENNPSNYRAYTNLGWVLMTLDRHDEADYSKDPARKGEAIDNYKQYLALKPNSALHETVLENIRRLEAEDKGQQAASS